MYIYIDTLQQGGRATFAVEARSALVVMYPELYTDAFISQQVFMKSFCKSQFPPKSANLFCILLTISWTFAVVTASEARSALVERYEHSR